MMTEKISIEEVNKRVSGLLNEIAQSFVSGVKITLLVRVPGNDDADFLLTNDELSEVSKAIERRTPDE